MLKLLRGRRSASAATGSDKDAGLGQAVGGQSAPSPDQAWKLLSIVNEWVRYADTKTGVTLAFGGATAALLLNALKDSNWTWKLTVSASLAGVSLILTALFAAFALFPRVRGNQDHSVDEEAVSLLFFGDIRRHYGEDRPTYRDVLTTLTADAARLTEQIADQIHANARVATIKFRWVNVAIVAEMAAIASTALTALIAAGGW